MEKALTYSPSGKKLAPQNKPNTTLEHVVSSILIWIWYIIDQVIDLLFRPSPPSLCTCITVACDTGCNRRMFFCPNLLGHSSHGELTDSGMTHYALHRLTERMIAAVQLLRIEWRWTRRYGVAHWHWYL
jgi:hypothetical protein